MITDFTQGEDVVDLHVIDAITGGTDDAFSFIHDAAFTGGGAAGGLRYHFVGSFTYVEGDTDGDGTADFQIAFKGHIAFVETDFGL